MNQTDHEKLASQTLNIVHERKNFQGTVPITALTNYWVPKGEEPHVIPDDVKKRKPEHEYPYHCLLRLLRDKFKFDKTCDYIVLSKAEIHPELQKFKPVDALNLEVWGRYHWDDLIWNLANGLLQLRDFGQIYLVIKSREVSGMTDQEKKRQQEIIDAYISPEESSDSDSDWAVELDPNAPEWFKPHFKFVPGKGFAPGWIEQAEIAAKKAAFYRARQKQVTDSDIERELIATSEESEQSSASDGEKGKGKGKAKAKKAFVPMKSRLPKPPASPSPVPSDDERGPSPGPRGRKAVPQAAGKRLAVPHRVASAASSRSAASRDQSQAAIKLQLIEDRAKYDTQEDTDDNYGAIDKTVIDTYVGAYNTGDSDHAWDTCLSFFNIDPDEWARQEGLRTKTAAAGGAARKRVPMKKLPGMTVGLFDYQLIGVLNLLRNVLWNVPGGLLADEQGLGKTQEMFGVIALAYNLRRSRAEVKAEWKSGKTKHHNSQSQAAEARTCKTDERWGFRCYCYNGLTQMLADALPEGPNFILGPERTAQQLFREGKSKLDTKVLKLRLEHENAAPEEKLSPKEIKALTGKINATVDGFEYHATPGQSDYIIISHNKALAKLTQGAFAVNVAQPGGATVKKSGFLPGIVLMDEFHEYTSPAPTGQETRTIQWLKFLKDHHPPLVYFVSGTPFGDSPADIRPAIELFDNPNFKSGVNERPEGITLPDFDKLINTFDNLLTRQNGGEALPMDELSDYRKLLNRFLGSMMVRRLGVDKFRGRNLTDIGPLSVKITDHQAPPALLDNLRRLSDETREIVNSQLPEGTTLGNFLRSQTGADLLLKLRLASTFPGISTPMKKGPEFPFTFTNSEISAHLASANGDLTKTPYYIHIPQFSESSPKIATILETVKTMIADKSKIPGESTSTKKLIIFSPLEAESMLIYGFLLLKKQKNKDIKPVWINSVHMDQVARQKVIDKFLTMGNGPPNILVAPMSLAGTGLNLQKAKYSIVTAPAWSKRDNQQAYYRVHRVGQTQETKLSLLTARWNPADRVLLRKYEGQPVSGSDEEIWGVGDEFGAGAGSGKGLTGHHQNQEGKEKPEEAK